MPATTSPPAPQHYAAAASLGAEGTDGLALPRPVTDGAWWRLFDDAGVDALVQQALQDNPGLQQATARAARAEALLQAQAAATRPAVDLVAGAARQVGPLVNAAGGRGSLFTAELQTQIDLDPLHRPARLREAVRQDSRAQRALAAQARLLLQADVVRLDLTRRALALEQAEQQAATDAAAVGLEQARRLQQAGLVPALQQAAAQIQWQTSRAEVTALARQREQLGHALAALLGRDDPPPAPADPALPALSAVPAGLPAQMLQRRPDVAAAHAALQAARLRLGLARDAWFPQFSLTAQAGLASSELGQWLRTGARQAGLGLLLALPLFDGGRRDAEQAQAEAELQAAAAAHRERVLQALREVNDELVAVQTTGEEAQARSAAAAAAMAQAQVANRLQSRGLLAAGPALQAQATARQARRAAVQAQLARHLATLGLVRALGGGWGDAPPLVAAR